MVDDVIIATDQHQYCWWHYYSTATDSDSKSSNYCKRFVVGTFV